MITVALTATVDCAGERVWRALVDRPERPLWDERVIGPIACESDEGRSARGGSKTRRPPADALHPAHALHAHDRPRALERRAWRFRFTDLPLVMVEEIHRIDPFERIATRVAIGSVHFDQLVTLHAEDDASGPRVRVGMKLVAPNAIAVFGGFVPRLDVQRLLIEYVDATLRQLRKHCESADREDVLRAVAARTKA